MKNKKAILLAGLILSMPVLGSAQITMSCKASNPHTIYYSGFDDAFDYYTHISGGTPHFSNARYFPPSSLELFGYVTGNPTLIYTIKKVTGSTGLTAYGGFFNATNKLPPDDAGDYALDTGLTITFTGLTMTPNHNETCYDYLSDMKMGKTHIFNGEILIPDKGYIYDYKSNSAPILNI